jgi:hypothetical protein
VVKKRENAQISAYKRQAPKQPKEKIYAEMDCGMGTEY